MKQKKKWIFNLLLVALSFFTFSANQLNAHAESEATEVETEEIVEIEEEILNESEVSTVVQGADGLLYVVLNEEEPDSEEPDSLLSLEEEVNASVYSLDSLTKEEGDFTAVEVAIDLERQEKANQSNEELLDFDDIDTNDLVSLQSAVNSEDLPFLEAEEVSTALSMSANIPESDEIIKQTRSFYAEEILNLTNNLNDIPITAKVSKAAVLASVTAKAEDVRINPPSGYGWVFYITRSNGYEWAEDYSARRTFNGMEAFCLQAGIRATDTYTDSGGNYLTTAKKELIGSFIEAYHALGGWKNDATGRYRWMATQVLIWENSLEVPKSILITPNFKDGVNAQKTQIATRASLLRTKPTFDRTSVTVNQGTDATFTIKNTNGASQLSVISSTGGTTATLSGNTVTVKTNNATESTATVTLKKGTANTPYIVWQNGSWQKMFSGRYYSEVKLTVNINRKGTVSVKKTDEKGNALQGAKFQFTYGQTTKEATSNNQGIAQLTDAIDAGTTVKVKEIVAPTNYKLDPTEFTIKVVANQDTPVTRTNKLMEGTVSVLKTDSISGKALAGAEFLFTYGSVTKQIKSNSNGVAALPDKITPGTVVKVKEVVAPTNYYLDSTEFTITVVANKDTPVTRKNEPYRGAVELTKITDVDSKALEGVFFQLYRNDGVLLRDNLKTNASGKITANTLPRGSYYLKEKQTVTGFQLDATNQNFTITSAHTETNPVKLTMSNKYNLSVSKTVSDVNETNKTANTWTVASNDFLEYNLTTSTINKLGTRNLPSLVLADNYDYLNLDTTSIKVYSGTTDVSSQFSITNSEGVIKATATATALGTNSFYGKTYTLRTRMKIKDSVLNGSNKAALKIVKRGSLSAGNKSVNSGDVTTTLPIFKYTVEHIDDVSKKVLKTDTLNKFDGESYLAKTLTSLKDAKGNTYRTYSNDVSGSIAGKDVKVTIPYVIPAIAVDLNQIEILTDQSGRGKSQEANLTFTRQINHEKFLDKSSYKVVIQDVVNNKVAYEKEFKSLDKLDTLKITLPLDLFNKDSRISYDLTIKEEKDPDNIDFITSSVGLRTYSYTSSEKVITNTDIRNGQLSYEAVVKTKYTRQTDRYEVFKENVSMNFNTSMSTKTGYGIPLELNPTYQSQINEAASLSFNLSVDEELVDTMINDEYKTQSGVITVPLDLTNRSNTQATNTRTIREKYEFPQVSVEAVTGNLFTQQQIARRDNRILHELKAGGRNFYIPIWQDLGVYTMNFSTGSFGRNLIQFDLDRTIDVYAFMYATMDSETKDIDELLLRPVFPDSEIPAGWTNQEIAWLRGNK